MDPSTLHRLQLLRDGNLRLSKQIREGLDQFVVARWDSMDAWRDADMVRLQNDILPAVAAAERRMVDLTNAYVASAEAAATGESFRPRPVDYTALTGAALRGEDPSALFMRPQMVVNYQLSRGASRTLAVKAGVTRLRSLAATNVQLAKTKTFAAQGTADYYRRVLTGDENCALCVIASTQRYRMGALLPIHPGCDCSEEGVYGQPSQVIDRTLLDNTHAEIAERLGDSDLWAKDLGIGKKDRLSDYTELIVTRQHGELGPVLAWRSEHFRDAAEAAGLTGIPLRAH